jgi:tetratricopeptide (TPR) repeat protein
VHVLGNLSTLACYQGDPARALELAQRALAVSEAAGLAADRRLPLGDMGAAAAALGDGDLARQTLEESLAIARQISDRTQEIFCLGHLGWLAVQQGQAAPALDHLRAALALAEQVNSLAEQSWLHAGLAEALRLAGHLDGAEMHAGQAADLANATGGAHARRLVKTDQIPCR